MNFNNGHHLIVNVANVLDLILDTHILCFIVWLWQKKCTERCWTTFKSSSNCCHLTFAKNIMIMIMNDERFWTERGVERFWSGGTKQNCRFWFQRHRSSFEAWQWSVIRRVRGIVVNVRSLIPSGEVLNFSDKNPKVKMHFTKHKIHKQIKISKHKVTTNTNDCPLNWKQFAASQTLIQSIASVAFHHLPGSDFHNWQFSEYGKLGNWNAAAKLMKILDKS